MHFAFYGRVSTEDHQDEHASRGWQTRRARELIEPHGGVIVEDFFDVGQSRSVPWPRRPESARLLHALPSQQRRWDGLVIGEPHRAFYGDQFQNTFPTLHHHGVQLWVPEVGGRVDPESEAHDLLMLLFGGMSKGERNRVKVRVRSAMADMTEREGRFLGGRPPYGYTLADAGAHPNPEKASLGVRLHHLEVDQVTGPVVSRIFSMYLAGYGYRAIAQALSGDGVPSPSQHDPARNPHRSRHAWASSAVRAILTNPRYLGYQVWGRQPRRETLIDPNRPAEGYRTSQCWAAQDQWMRSKSPSHQALVNEATWQAVQALIGKKGGNPARQAHGSKPSGGRYLLTGMVSCGICGRKMSGHRIEQRLGYVCRIRKDYALPSRGDGHPKRLFVSERALAATVDGWLGSLLSAQGRRETVETMVRASTEADPARARAERDCREAERRITRLLDALESGTIEEDEVADRLRRLRRQRDAARAQLNSANPTPELTSVDILALLDELGGLTGAMDQMRRGDRESVYRAANLRITYHPSSREVDLALTLNPGGGASERVGGGTRYNAARPLAVAEAVGSSRIGKSRDNSFYEVGTTDLWLPAA